MIMAHLQPLILKICQPNPKIIPDPEKQKALLAQNKTCFSVILITTIFRATAMLFASFSPEFDFIQFCLLANLLVLFLVFCRSFPTTLDIAMTICSCFWCFFGLVQYTEVVIFYFGLVFVVPPFIYFLTKSIALMCASAVFQGVVLLTSYKTNLTQYLFANDPNVFIERFVQYGVVVLVFIVGGYSAILVALDKKTIELSTAVKRTEESLEQQKTFVYSFSHELRNPINSLLGNLQLVLMSNVSAEVREMVNTSKICGELLLNLINTVLDAGKLDIGNLEVNPVPTRIHDVLQRVWTISNDILTKKNLTSHLKIEKKVPPILLLDCHRVNQILMNLLGNAIKFTQKGSSSVTVKWIDSTKVTDKCFEPIPYDNFDEGLFEKEENMYLVKMENQGKEASEHFTLGNVTKEFNLKELQQPRQIRQGVLKIIVKDTGCGMTNDDLNKIFRKFSQVGRDTTQRQLGTGLGLFISRELCRNMKGDIRGYSKSNVGATFVVCIPTVTIQSNHILAADTQISTIQKQLSSKNLKALVADDSPFNVNLICSFFAKTCSIVSGIANNGQDAYLKYIELVEAGTPVDIVALDIDMPIMSGKVACEKIRQYEREKCLRPAVIMLISGNYDEQHLTELLKKGKNNKADCFLRKPLLFEEFCWAVFQCIPSHQSIARATSFSY